MASSNPHSAGIFADMTVDGPEIGTLVLVVDRAKNLPNRKTMGKQNPYCAARLGKEARKTETDQRGGQTPRWDQELRFTVHDSPDYYQLKISCFSEDKRTDLIGEAWINLENVVVPGGGKNDLWQGLSCRGKYAGDIRIELTYYDSREKPEKGEHIVSVAEELKQTYGSLTPSVKRRPLPVNPNAPSTIPIVIPDRAHPGRAKHGPRDFATPTRAASLPPEGPKTYNYPHSQSTLFGNGPASGHQYGNSSAGILPSPVEQYSPQQQYYGEYDPNLGPQAYEPQDAYTQPDFLPTLGPRRREREPLPSHSTVAEAPSIPPQQYLQAHGPVPTPHARSAPAVPTVNDHEHQYDDNYQLRTDYPQPIPDIDYQYQHVRQRRNDMPPDWEQEYGSSHSHQQLYSHDAGGRSPPPPPPPMHSNSSPAVPQYGSPHNQPYPSPTGSYGTTPPQARQYVPRSSPLQSIELGYAPQQTLPSHRHPARGQSLDTQSELSQYLNSYGSTPNLTPPRQATSPLYGRTPPSGRQHPGRYSVQDPYNTQSRPHPLSQEVPRARSPNPYARHDPQAQACHIGHRGRDAASLIKPRAVSPQPDPEPSQPNAWPKNTYSLQHPVRAFESSDDSPLSTSRRPTQTSNRGSLPRKSVSPRPSFSGDSPSGTPYSPDSFGVHNPSTLPTQDNTSPSGPIVGWHGQEIDPSDHLPVNSWAPEPEKKLGNKTYGLGRERDFGPRTPSNITNTAGRVSQDIVINTRPNSTDPDAGTSNPSKIRARLVNKSSRTSSPLVEPLRDHHNYNSIPNPYEQQEFSRNFRDGGSAEQPYGYAYAAPSVPPKVPLARQNYGEDALSREVSSIDLGPSGRRPQSVAFVPVRSHQDRGAYY